MLPLNRSYNSESYPPSGIYREVPALPEATSVRRSDNRVWGTIQQYDGLQEQAGRPYDDQLYNLPNDKQEETTLTTR